MSKLEDLLHRKFESTESLVHNFFGNGFELNTESFLSNDPFRVLPIGGPQDAILNYLAHHPEIVADKNIFEPFAGSGIFGLMALKMGANSADLLDINPRAIKLQIENAEKNNLNNNKLRCINNDINNYLPDRKYDLIIANPPFVPTPKDIRGVIHSNGGFDGNELCNPLIENISRWLEPTGEALIYMSQLMVDGKPYITNKLISNVEYREIEITIIQKESDSFDSIYESYLELFPSDSESIKKWKEDIYKKLGNDIGSNHCIIHIQPMGTKATIINSVYNIDEKFGFGGLDQYPIKEVTRSRIRENVL